MTAKSCVFIFVLKCTELSDLSLTKEYVILCIKTTMRTLFYLLRTALWSGNSVALFIGFFLKKAKKLL